MTDPQHRLSPIRSWPLVLAVGLALSLTTLVLAGCTLFGSPSARDPLAVYRPALQPGFSVDPARLDAFLAYSITVRVDPAQRAFTGTTDVSIPITGSIPNDEFFFRLYPNLNAYNGSMEVSSARVDGLSVNYGYSTDGTAVHVSTPSGHKPGQRVQIRLCFTGKFSSRADGSYTLFGLSEHILNLANFYPILAGRRGAAWALDIADPQGDVGFHDIALYRVNVTLPVGQVVAASGTATGAEPAEEGWVTYHYVQGPAREFTLLMSPDFRVQEASAYGTRVRSYYLEGAEDAGRSALYDAATALEIYSDRFGPYPYRDMAVVEAPLTFHGMEFPGLSLVGTQTYGEYKKDLETRIAHEVAHQWWYNQVGSDQIESPWLDEGLTEFSMYYYFADRYGVPVADALRRLRWETPVKTAKANGLDAPIGRPVNTYKNNYETIVYAKGALFFAAVRDEVGPEVFQKVLRTYLERYKWQIATPDDLQSLVAEVSGRDLSTLFSGWIRGE